ncbi:MAG: hypothetical protein O9353_09185, partial [Bacteroidia bacterium]|nr:hypothetical protein [Bacteroidia bacterium]
ARWPGFGKAEHGVQGVTLSVIKPKHFYKNPLDSLATRIRHLGPIMRGFRAPIPAKSPPALSKGHFMASAGRRALT